jgi:hypothetical protein
MSKEGAASAKVIQKRQTPHVVIHSDRASGTYVNGIFLEEKEERATVLMYTQPISRKLEQNEIGERSVEDRNGWSTKVLEIKNKDKVEIGIGIFTINNIQEWPLHVSFDLKRTGERQNIAEGVE